MYISLLPMRLSLRRMGLVSSQELQSMACTLPMYSCQILIYRMALYKPQHAGGTALTKLQDTYISGYVFNYFEVN